jgi:hypothetical protein
MIVYTIPEYKLVLTIVVKICMVYIPQPFTKELHSPVFLQIAGDPVSIPIVFPETG